MTPGIRTLQPEPSEHLDKGELDESTSSGRMLRLDRQIERPAAVDGSLDQLLQREHAIALVARLTAAASPAAEVELGQVGELEFLDSTAAAGGAVDPAVMHTDEDTVTGQPDVALETVGTFGNRPAIGRERVLRLVSRRATVRDHLHTACRRREHDCMLARDGGMITALS